MHKGNDSRLNEALVIKVAAFTSGKNQPSSRFRVRQYIAPLETMHIEVTEFFTMFGGYPPLARSLRPFWAPGSVLSRVPSVLRSHQYDVTLLQREMLSTFFTLEGLTKKPRILDVDDAIWLNRENGFAKRLARICDSVICGNSFLADYFSKCCSRTIILPTAVDTERFRPLETKPENEIFTIGWSGGNSGFPDLLLVQKPLQHLLENHPEMRFRVISNEPPPLNLPPAQVEFVKWSPEIEVRALQELDIGIMPLRDNLWSQGKCAYKMLLYMSCGVPVVVSPVGVNKEISDVTPVGATAVTSDDWVGALEQLSRDRKRLIQLGQNGRQVVLESYSVNVLAPKLASEILYVSGNHSVVKSENSRFQSD